MDTVKAIIFDFGGVLMRTADPVGRREWEARLGLAVGQLERAVHGCQEWLQVQQGLLSDNDYWQSVARNLGIIEDSLPQLQRDYFRDDELDRDLIALIDDLRRSGYRVGLLSNDSTRLESKLRTDLAIFDHFDALVIS